MNSRFSKETVQSAIKNYPNGGACSYQGNDRYITLYLVGDNIGKLDDIHRHPSFIALESLFEYGQVDI